MRSDLLSFMLLAAAMIPAANAEATPLSPEEALARVYGTSGRRMPAYGKCKMRLVRTVNTDTDATPGVYLFASDTGGYIVAGADDRAPSLLGYSDSGRIDTDALPPAMQYWLDEYAAQIKAIRATDGARARAASSVEGEPISPLLTTTWHQRAPFNLRSPLIDGLPTPAGCVAIAMAQAMNYRQWPIQGTGQHSYTFDPGVFHEEFTGSYTLECDFGAITFDWENMSDHYGDFDYTDRQAAAAADLAYACAVSVDMYFTPLESGAVTYGMAPALVKYFGYDKGTAFLERIYYGISEWEQLVYDQLRDYGPVIYCGSNNHGAHAFVCDGYETGGYFHINWGWDGVSDGYFLLSALSPGEQGIGSSTGGYNARQEIVANLCRPVADPKITVNVVLDADFGIAEDSAAAGGTVTAIAMSDEDYFINNTIGSLYGTFGLKITPEEGTPADVLYTTGGGRAEGMEYKTPLDSYSCTLPTKIPDGTYTVSPAFMDDRGEWYDIRVAGSRIRSAIMEVAEGVCTFGEGDQPIIIADDIDILSEIYLDNLIHVRASLINIGDLDFHGEICPAIVTDDDIVALADAVTVSLEPEGITTIDYTGALDKYDPDNVPAPGVYGLCLVEQASMDPISDIIEVRLGEKPDITLITASAPSLNGIEGEVSVPGGEISFSTEVSCTEGYFGGSVVLLVLEPLPDNPERYESTSQQTSAPIFIGKGESCVVTLLHTLEGSAEGRPYCVGIFNEADQSSISEFVYFTVTDGITGVQAPSATGMAIMNAGDSLYVTGVDKADIEVYTSSGVKVISSPESASADISSLAGGIYLAVARGTDGTSAVTKIVRR